MGKAIRWLKSVFGFKKEQNPSYSGDRKDKIPSCIGRSRRESTVSPPETPLKPLYNSDDQNKRAIAVANATAVAADAAVAAAQAAVEFVRLTSQNRLTTAARVNSAAIKIQSMFRGYLARKALKALKSLVKLQAVVRGYLVRKEAAETLQGMEALIRAQSSVSAHRSRLQDDKFNSKRSIKRANEARSRTASFQVPIEGTSKSRLTRANTWAWDSEAHSPRFSTPYLATHNEFDPRYFTTHNTPRFAYSCGSSSHGSVFDGMSKDDSFTSHPGYMANTKSFRAKVRSQSAPKQRPDFGLGLKRGVVLDEVVARGPKSKSPSLLEVNNFKNFVMSRIGKSSKV